MKVRWQGIKSEYVLTEARPMKDIAISMKEKCVNLLKALLNKVIKESEEPKSESGEILELIQKTRIQWNQAMGNFEFAYENDMIDYYIYQIKASQVQYGYLLKKAKGMGIRSNIIATQV